MVSNHIVLVDVILIISVVCFVFRVNRENPTGCPSHASRLLALPGKVETSNAETHADGIYGYPPIHPAPPPETGRNDTGGPVATRHGTEECTYNHPMSIYCCLVLTLPIILREFRSVSYKRLVNAFP